MLTEATSEAMPGKAGVPVCEAVAPPTLMRVIPTTVPVTAAMTPVTPGDDDDRRDDARHHHGRVAAVILIRYRCRPRGRGADVAAAALAGSALRQFSKNAQ